MKKIKYNDYAKLAVPHGVETSHWMDFYATETQGRKGLRVKMKASHAGYLNDNYKVYIPSRMADGVATFRTGEKPTKILKHHDMHSDPIGVVRGARFVPTIPDDLRNNIDVMNLMSSSTPIKTQIKSIKNLLRSGVINRDGWQGLGYIELVADIMDKDSIEKILDGRFDAVSTHFVSPGAAYCLICGQNWAADGPCEHEPFETYEDEENENFKMPAIPIAGIHKYLEASLVSLEGDKLVTLEVQDSLEKDSSIHKYFSCTDCADAHSVFEFKDFLNEEDFKMSLTEKEKAIFEIAKKYKPEMAEDALAELSKKFAAQCDEQGNMPSQLEAGIDFETSVIYAIDDLEFEGKEMTNEVLTSIDAMYIEEFSKMKDEKLIEEQQFTDAKLSTEKRKNLPEASFCGPGKSFPVPDCAHVTAARRLIGRYKGPGSKSSILACVSRKAKALGCGTSSSDSSASIDTVLPTKCLADTIKDMAADGLKSLAASVELEMKSRGLASEPETCKSCVDSLAKIQALESEKDVLTKKYSDLELAHKDSNNVLVVLRHELQRTQSDYVSLVDSYVELGAKFAQSTLEKAAQIGVLSGKYDTLAKATDDLKTKDAKSIELLFADFDIMNIVSKMNDGMSNRNPMGTVENPSVNIDADNRQIEALDGPGKAAIESMVDSINDNDNRTAKHIYDTMKSMKVFPEDLTFEKILSIAKK